jgi:ribosomal-protein-serine acetyltransferase
MDVELKTVFRVDDEIVLRAFLDDDAQAVFDCAVGNLEHLRAFLHWMSPDYSIETAREFITTSREAVSERKGLPLGIFRRRDFIGSVGLVRFVWAPRKSEIGYWVDKANEGKGIVSSACKVLIEYAFGELGLNRIEIRCSAENVRSAAIPERLGVKKEGVLRQSEWRSGRLHDYAIYGLLADEWRVR